VAARTLFEESLAIERALGDQQSLAHALNGLSEICHAQGDRVSARTLQEEALAIRRAVGDRPNALWSLHRSGNIAAEQGDDTTARTRYAEALTLAREMGHRGEIAIILHCFAGLALASAQPERALHLAGAAAALHETTDCPLRLAEQAAWERRLHLAHQMLSETAAAAAWAQGRAMALEQAIATALEDDVVR
jgi:tetratricopeptide (TPR) repeat protein